MTEHKTLSLAEFAKSITARNKYSQFGEDGIIEAIFKRIGTTNRWCVECGAADGLFFSNTRKLIEEGWSSIQIEADEEKYSKLCLLYEGNLQVFPISQRLTSEWGFDQSLPSFSRLATLPQDFDLLVVDVDGHDYYLWNSMLTYRPRVVICEFDPNAHPDFIPEIGGPGQAGERAIHHVALARGYQPICKTWCNLICVRNDLCHLLADNPEEVAPLDPMQSGILAVFAGVDVETYRERAEASEPEEAESAQPLVYGYTEQQLVEAKAGREREGKLMIAACMSTPRFGPLSTMDVIQTALAQWSVPWFRGEGGYWHHQLTDSIERGLKLHPDAILTFDYDSLFCPAPSHNDIAKLVTLMIDHPDVDVFVPLQMKREGGPLLASTQADVNIDQPLIQVWLAHFGMTIFRASVFDRLSKPWFWERPDPSGSWGEGRIDADIGFWTNCQEHGIKVCIATDVLLGHGEYNVTFPDDQFKPLYMPLNAWRKNGQRPPAEAFNRARFVEAAVNGQNGLAKVLDMGS